MWVVGGGVVFVKVCIVVWVDEFDGIGGLYF